jgi:hypothetical protein
LLDLAKADVDVELIRFIGHGFGVVRSGTQGASDDFFGKQGKLSLLYFF